MAEAGANRGENRNAAKLTNKRGAVFAPPPARSTIVSVIHRNEISEAEMDRTLAESFPASDPPSWNAGIDRSGR